MKDGILFLTFLAVLMGIFLLGSLAEHWMDHRAVELCLQTGHTWEDGDCK